VLSKGRILASSESMFGDLHARCRHDVERLPISDPANGLNCLLVDWLADSEWVEAARRIPRRDRRQLLGELGASIFDQDRGGYASHLRNCTQGLDYVWPPASREDLLRRHCQFLLAGLSDTLSFKDPAETPAALDEVDLRGLDHLREAQDAFPGVLFLSVHQSHPAFGFKHRRFDGLPISGVANLRHDPGDSLSMLLMGVSDRVRLLPISPAAVRQMLTCLRSGESVAIYADYVYPQSGAATSCLFGRAVTISSSAVAIAVRTGAAVIPVAVARRWPLDAGGVDVRLFAPLSLADLDPRDDATVSRAAVRFGVAIEGLIRCYPAQWRLWGTLEHRWAETARHTQTTLALARR
jgi:lauroyl/myristoyl acyltransferase